MINFEDLWEVSTPELVVENNSKGIQTIFRNTMNVEEWILHSFITNRSVFKGRRDLRSVAAALLDTKICTV